MLQRSILFILTFTFRGLKHLLFRKRLSRHNRTRLLVKVTRIQNGKPKAGLTMNTRNFTPRTASPVSSLRERVKPVSGFTNTHTHTHTHPKHTPPPPSPAYFFSANSPFATFGPSLRIRSKDGGRKSSRIAPVFGPSTPIRGYVTECFGLFQMQKHVLSIQVLANLAQIRIETPNPDNSCPNQTNQSPTRLRKDKTRWIRPYHSKQAKTDKSNYYLREMTRQDKPREKTSLETRPTQKPSQAKTNPEQKQSPRMTSIRIKNITCASKMVKHLRGLKSVQ